MTGRGPDTNQIDVVHMNTERIGIEHTDTVRMDARIDTRTSARTGAPNVGSGRTNSNNINWAGAGSAGAKLSGAEPGAAKPGPAKPGAAKPGAAKPTTREPNTEPFATPRRSRKGPRKDGRRRRSGRRRGRGGWLLVLALLAAIVAGGGFVLHRTPFGVPDYDGPGQGDVIIQVNDGDTTSAIGAELVRADVVRSVKAFIIAAAEDHDRIRSVQPGFYRLHLRMSGQSAVASLLDPRSRVGQLEIKGGVQLDDTRSPDGTVVPGVLALASQATCTQLNGVSTCVSADALRNAMVNTSIDQLGVPEWARTGVAKAEPNRRLEGLVIPGRYDVRPGDSAENVLRTLVTRSGTQLEANGLLSAAEQTRYSPYQLLVIASLVEKEGLASDFGKISRVIHNRLSSRVRLELDSTVNYPLDLQEVRTSTADRGRTGAYNSYLNYGLPPTPIGAPGKRAIEAAEHPTPGPWMFFVKCRKDGTSCFAVTLAEHQQNVRAAMAAGAF